MSNKQVIYNVAMYLRLSKDDGDNIESESITNQRKIIKEYIDKHPDMKLYNEYVDDGYTGANFDRPAFKIMIKDIENKKVNMVITKNLARLGRNYIETGTYIEKYFPDHSVRYIAIFDKVDNFNDNISNDFIPIKSVFNEKYCKDTSIAIKKTKRKKMQEGFYACNTAPFGYKKDPNNAGKLIIDKESSKTVKKIFELKEKGYTTPQIVKYLDKNHYKTPAEYLNIKGLEKVKNKEIWRKSSVTRILSNKVYLGHCIRGKTQNISYKSKDRIYVKRNEFIMIPNTHEPIISEETFNNVHNTNKYGTRRKHEETNYLFKDFIYCKSCGKKLIFRKEREKVYIYCRNHSENSKLCPNNCKINYKHIEDKIIKFIIKIYKEYFKSTKLKNSAYQKYVENITKRQIADLEILKINLRKINFKITSLYNQRLSESINEDEYKNRYNALTEQRKSITEKISQTEKKMEDNKLNTLSQKKNLLKKISKLEKSDFRNFEVKELIKKIEVLKKEVYIYFNFSEVKKIKN